MISYSNIYVYYFCDTTLEVVELSRIIKTLASEDE